MLLANHGHAAAGRDVSTVSPAGDSNPQEMWVHSRWSSFGGWRWFSTKAHEQIDSQLAKLVENISNDRSVQCNPPYPQVCGQPDVTEVVGGSMGLSEEMSGFSMWSSASVRPLFVRFAVWPCFWIRSWTCSWNLSFIDVHRSLPKRSKLSTFWWLDMATEPPRLTQNYETYCDPRLNYHQAIEARTERGTARNVVCSNWVFQSNHTIEKKWNNHEQLGNVEKHNT